MARKYQRHPDAGQYCRGQQEESGAVLARGDQSQENVWWVKRLYHHYHYICLILFISTRLLLRLHVPNERSNCDNPSGTISVTLDAMEEYADFVVRHFSVEKAEEDKRQVTQYQFVSWPDHGKFGRWKQI